MSGRQLGSQADFEIPPRSAPSRLQIALQEIRQRAASMNPRETEVLRQFAAEVRRQFPTAQVWAFGSRVRGQAREDSDLDVCVVLDDLDEPTDAAIMRIAWRVGFDHDVVITTVTYSKDEFGRGPLAVSPLVLTIRREGVAA